MVPEIKKQTRIKETDFPKDGMKNLLLGGRFLLVFYFLSRYNIYQRMKNGRYEVKNMKKLIGILVLLVVLVGGFLGYQGYERGQQTELFEEATVYFKEKDYRKAIEFLEMAKEKNNLFSGSIEKELSYYQAEAYMNLEEYDKAVKIYNRFIADEPKEPMNYMLKGYCYTKAKNYEKAVVTYEAGYEKTGEGDFILRLCNMYITTKKFDKALELIEENRDGKDEAMVKKLSFAEIVIYEKQQDYLTAYEKAKAFTEDYPDDEDGKKEMEFLESRQ